MKRLLSLLCALSLCLGMAGTIGENDPINQKLTAVTQAVVDTLDIGEEYTGFEGSYNDGRWSLRWSAEDTELNINCADDGTVLSYSKYSWAQETKYSTERKQLPSFPKYSPEELKAAADKFLSRVITKSDWGWELSDFTPSLYRGYYGEAYASGRLTLGSVKTDIVLSVSLDPMTCEVRSYSRSDGFMPYDDPAVTEFNHDEAQKQAAYQKLLAQYGMELAYAVTDPDDMAHLVYRRTDGKRLALSYKTGELVPFELDVVNTAAQTAYGMEADEAEDAGMSMKRALTETELKGIALYDGVLSAQELDAKLRAMPELGLTKKDALTGKQYVISNEKPYAHLSYERELNNGQTLYRNFTLDAISGRMTSCYAYSDVVLYKEMTEDKADTAALQEKAEAFLRNYYAEYVDNIVLSDASNAGALTRDASTVRYTFSRVHKGYPFRENSISVRIDAKDGSVCGFNLNWNDGQEFYEYEKEELISIEDARLAWLGDSEFTAMYLSVPQKKNSREALYTLTPCWCFDEKDYVYAVDAKTGKRYGEEASGTSRYEYADTENMLYADEIKTLGQYGIGLKDYGFTKKDLLYNRQIMILALQVKGYTGVEAYSDEQLERTFKSAFPAMEISIYQDLAHTKLTEVLELVILAGYKDVAQLKGIWHLDAADWDSVSEEGQGPMAIAYALGLYELEDGNINGMRRATTAEFMHGLYVLLSR